MEYVFMWNNSEYTLPRYTFDIAEKLEKQVAVNASNQKFKEKCKSMYDVISYILGKEKTNEIIGDFNKADANEINIVYLKIVSAYNKPVESFTMENTESTLDSIPYEKITDMIDAVAKLENIKK